MAVMPGGLPADHAVDAAAIAALADAWSGGSTAWAKAVGPDGLAVAVGMGAPVEVSLEALASIRDAPPSLVTEDCEQGTVNQAVGEPLLAAFLCAGSQGSPVGVGPAGVVRVSGATASKAPDQPVVRACVQSGAEGVRVEAVEAGLQDRPTTEESLPRVFAPMPPAAPKAPADGPAKYNVVLIAAEDTLAARAGPKHDAATVYQFSHSAREILGTGEVNRSDDAMWVSGRKTPKGPAWVDRTYLSRARNADEMASMPQYRRAPLDLLQAVSGEGTPSLGSRGLYFMHYAAPIKITAGDWQNALAESRKFDGVACEDCIDGTTGKILGAALTDTLRDANAKADVW